MRRKVFIVAGMAGCLLVAACGKTKEKETPTPTVTAAPTQEVEQGGSGITNFLFPTVEPTKAPEPTPTLRCNTKSDVIKVEEEGVLILQSEISYPVFDGIGAEGLNRQIDALLDAFREEFSKQEKNAKLDYADSKKNGETFVTEHDDFFITVSGMTEELISCISVRFTDAGNPHPNFYQTGHVFQVSDGSEVTIDQYLKAYNVSAAEAAEYAAAEFLAQVNNDMDAFILDKALSEEVLALVENNHWYFSDAGVVVFANPYEIAAYEKGTFMSVIPFEKLKEGLKNK